DILKTPFKNTHSQILNFVVINYKLQFKVKVF
ncbi:unnamed protein product, partial [marine sediment metagenome]